MKYKILTYLCLGTIFACDANIGISPGDTQDDNYDSIQSSTENDTSEETVEDVGESLEDFVVSGPHEVLIETKSAPVTDCNINYYVYSPADINDPPVVILAHGFARGSETMTGWADHLSSWGVEVLLPTLCHYNIFAGVDHEKNGQNMIELGQYHGADEVVYAGHSAGGLAAIIAASLDNNNLGVLGLDTTDTEDIPGIPDFIGQQYASNINTPAFLVRGEASSCNSNSNGLSLFEMIDDSYEIKVDQSDHCDFEFPTNFGCEINCENSNATIPDEEIRPLIITLGTSAILSLVDLSDAGWIIWMGS